MMLKKERLIDLFPLIVHYFERIYKRYFWGTVAGLRDAAFLLLRGTVAEQIITVCMSDAGSHLSLKMG